MALQLHTVTPRQGLAWVQHAFRLFFQRPMALASLFLVFLFAGLVLLVLPYAGALLLISALPLLTLGYMIATRSALAGGPVHPGQLVEPFRPGPGPAAGAGGRDDSRRRALVALCLLYALATVAVIWLSDGIDGGRFERLQVLIAAGKGDDATTREIDALLVDPALRTGLAVRFGLAVLLALPFWHAPALVWWGGQGVAQALFSSTLACWRTRGAFLVYGLAWVGVIGVFGLLAGALFSLLGALQLVSVAALPAGLMFTTVFYTSLYFSFADTFGAPG